MSEVIEFEVRPSASPYVERVWRARSRHGGSFTSIAASNLEIVVERRERPTVTLRGPETAASRAQCPPNTTWIGIRLRVGTFVRSVPSDRIRDGRDVSLDVHDGSFVLVNGVALELPSFRDAETFVHGLASAGCLGRDVLVVATVAGMSANDTGAAASRRTVQRRFARVTGLSNQAFAQIERARCATHLLRGGCDIADVVFLAGFVDQAHLGRALQRYVGMTPAAVRRGDAQLSLLYKTDTVPWAHIGS